MTDSDAKSEIVSNYFIDANFLSLEFISFITGLGFQMNDKFYF